MSKSLSKSLLAIVPGIAGSLIAVYALSGGRAEHAPEVFEPQSISVTPEIIAAPQVLATPQLLATPQVVAAPQLSAAPQAVATPGAAGTQGDGLSAEERRELTRQMLRARRENPEVPAEVRPMMGARAEANGVAETVAEPKGGTERTGSASLMPLAGTGAVALPLAITAPAVTQAAAFPPPPVFTPPPAVTPAPVATPPVAAAPVATPPWATPLPAARPTVFASRARPEPAPPPPLAPPVVVTAPSQLPSVVVSAPPPPPVEPERRGFASNMFSSISVFAGKTANATGDTVNWVIDLPGRAISAGGKLIGRDSASTTPPPPPPVLPPPNRGAL